MISRVDKIKSAFGTFFAFLALVGIILFAASIGSSNDKPKGVIQISPHVDPIPRFSDEESSSGLHIYTDNLTGQQYLGAWHMGITPLLKPSTQESQ